MEKALLSVLQWWDESGVEIPAISKSPGKARRGSTRPKSNASDAGLAASGRQSRSLTDPRARTTSKLTPPVTRTPHDIAAVSARASQAKTLDELKALIENFDAFTLSDGARHCIFARGNPQSDIMIIGDPPGRDEDMRGQAFAGRNGQLLDKMMQSIGLRESDLYMTHITNWSTTHNRTPKQDDIDLCKPFLLRHIELFDPKIIVILGGMALESLTGMSAIMKSRGQWTTLSLNAKTIPALPLYHPSLLLRQPALKRDMWRDLLSLKAHLAGH